ncbi:hypothetical protein AMES_7010 [Amycolatopsis mediterranei S699]|uniref:Uncharacterized protein n=2 Tax=Amycolatopsis mediterranei TaxID=33910 RepID=A0A0H3DD37_AMYMU|nr:hypothetical protein [Amycolatopsis mediterranei]ADJ48835.1 hypothetical protein AMED_7117 [Amycolatopsis mediterranei U32]AEK45779.1 hypothetical protein RAM_36540 [Amycolatopsis mediterranei S699]AFO80545.1 hypothetical protein AMES_7010 [Amycolatopsis mediterranei S699]AGT87673.1 hypothetical protein B737_7010 [Amycolatopsis mediterranei RB]KDU94051.1 hypothetical protein DV36_01550 [Amycolatopsis mediterranei]
MTSVAAPYWVSELSEIVGELQRGKWMIARWEDLGPDEDLAHWQATVREACTADIDPVFIDVRRRSLTIVLNAALPAPDDEQIHLSIAAIENSRFTGRSIRAKHKPIGRH